jgi:hypothetical protein
MVSEEDGPQAHPTLLRLIEIVGFFGAFMVMNMEVNCKGKLEVFFR